ncbi:MAG: DNA adenine methylase [Elusimicrobiota bacterium]|jgi:DNA adenine methylase|nr:DNA adenine methylase [Elusimicrobiota bacterium]
MNSGQGRLFDFAQGASFLESESSKAVFLSRLKSPTGKTKYKRYMGSPLRYAGGKSLAVGLIIEQFPENLNRLISPFLGGGAVEIACVKELGLKVRAFDIFDLLINYWQIQILKPHLLFKELLKLTPTPETFIKVKKTLKKHWLGEKLIDDKIKLAAYYYFNHNTSYGPGFLSWPSYVYLQDKRYQTLIEKVRDTQLSNMKAGCASFEKVFKRYADDFFYCDPPYFLEGDSKMFKGIYPQRNFPIHHKNFDHKLLRDCLINHRGKFVLSYNDCSTIREWYRGYKILEVGWQYTMGQGETRIGFNRINKNINHVKQSHEILIVKDWDDKVVANKKVFIYGKAIKRFNHRKLY